jgi:hypothetical protein
MKLWLWALAELLLVVSFFTVANAESADSGCVSAGSGGDYFNALADCETSPHEAAPATSANATDGDSETTYSYDPVCIRGEGIQGVGFYGCGGQMGLLHG